MNHVKFVGLHFHIGSQILDMGDFIALCNRVNELQEKLYARQIIVEHINVGGGLGIDYAHPTGNPSRLCRILCYLPQAPEASPATDFTLRAGPFCSRTMRKPHHTRHIRETRHQQAIRHCRCRHDRTSIRPALYQAYHKIENISSEEPVETYDVVGPICESSDVFGKAIDLNRTHRGDFLAIRSAGAYGEIMASGTIADRSRKATRRTN